jgi:L-serine dehydratase
MFDSLQALVKKAGGAGMASAARKAQARLEGVTEESLNLRMAEALDVMRQSADRGMDPALRSMSGMTGGQAAQLWAAAASGTTAGGSLLGRAEARALAIAEYNAAMGRIVAAPTAGACGILPAALLTAQEEYGLTDAALVDALFTAAAVGLVIAGRASISGAEAGCQSECGSAAGMAAAALTQLRGGTPAQAADACGFALMNVMGLVCDPVHGLVEVPCVYRNVAGVANALSAADLALAGICCPIPPDEVIDAMKAVGEQMPSCLRETGEGGCAGCPSVSGGIAMQGGERG